MNIVNTVYRPSAVCGLVCVVVLVGAAAAVAARQTQSPATSSVPTNQPKEATRGAGAPGTLKADEVAAQSVAILLKMQESIEEGGPKSEWPYEGVYRVSRKIPIGYRVGGTSIAAICLLRCPGYAQDEARREAVRKAAEFVCAQTAHPLMSAEKYDGGYDVRGWGYAYALAFLLELKAREGVPAEQKELAEKVESTIAWCIAALDTTEIPEAGGWNYARPPGRETVAPASPFMTGPALQALFAARKQGYAVSDEVVARALAALERQRTETGSFTYAGDAKSQRAPEPVPGAVGRMLVGECTLYLADRSDLARVRAALDAFLAHWDRLEERRARDGTHAPPFNVAPYYFFYAHYYAAQAIELLPRADRAEYRRRLAGLLARTRSEDGSWNDRVFPRSANYGTAMSTMALLMPSTPEPARYVPK